MLVVPDSTKGRPAISSDKEPIPDRPKQRVPEWDKEPGGFDGYEAKDAWTELFKESFGFLVPKYDSLSVFLIAITWILFLITNPKSQDHILNMISYFPTRYPFLNMLSAGLAFLTVLWLCFYMVLSGREKTNAERITMAFFAVITTIITAYASGIYLMKSYKTFDRRIISNWWIIFPIWNLINARILVQMLFTGIINEDCVSERRATPIRVIFGLLSVLTIFAFCNYVFDLHWAITFSICIVYTTSFDKALQSVFPTLSCPGEDQSP
jgi:hypothetical protein